jgi:hypothetical protein
MERLMKAILEFNLSDPESDDRMEHHQAINGWRYSLVLSELDSHLRSIEKYEDKHFERNVLAEELREWLRDEMYNQGVILDA